MLFEFHALEFQFLVSIKVELDSLSSCIKISNFMLSCSNNSSIMDKHTKYIHIAITFTQPDLTLEKSTEIFC